MLYRLLVLLLPLIALAKATSAPARPEPPLPADAGATVYRRVLPATVWVHSPRGGGRLATGSGSLIDRGRRLVLTNYHVVGEVKKALVFFPDFGRDKRAIPERQHYLDNARRLAIPGEVVETDKQADLALIRLDRLPEGAIELPLAERSPEPGQPVHSIGNPGKSGALWVYTPGKVRQVYTKRWKAKLDERTILEFHAKVIETDSPTNPGDSGGPLVNDRAELVGVTQGGALDAQALSLFVDLSEVKRFLNRRSVQALRSTEPGPSGASRADRPPANRDEGQFFSSAAWQELIAAAERLAKERQLDLVVETVPQLPGQDPEQLRGLPPAEREAVFRSYAREQARAGNVHGLYVVICRNPSTLYVERTESAANHISEETVRRMRDALLGAFREKRFDDGLRVAVGLLLQSQGLAPVKEVKK